MTHLLKTARARASVRRTPFGLGPDGAPADAWVLRNAGGTEVTFLPYGGTIISIRVPNREALLADVALGLDTLEAYEADERFFGGIVGRYANRIAGASFTLDGATHQLSANEGEHHLHGGAVGFHRVWWEVEPFTRDGAVGAVLRYTSRDGEEGYPGTLSARATYTLTDRDELTVEFEATTDRATPVSLTQHSYFNLAGHDAGDALGHELTLNASQYLPVDETLIPAGEPRPVRGTPFDFTAARTIGARIAEEDEQLLHGKGYDHCFLLDGIAAGDRDVPVLAARLRDPASGRMLELYTTEPALQLYTGGGLDGGATGKGGRAYSRFAGIALEPQRLPDAPNRPEFPSAILRPGEVYRSKTVYRFSVEGAS